MYQFFIGAISLFSLLASSNLLAHPHHTAQDEIAQHGMLGAILDLGPYALVSLIVGFIAYKVFKYLDESSSDIK